MDPVESRSKTSKIHKQKSDKTLIFVAKLEDILDYFIVKSIKKLNFPAKNLDFDSKLDLKNIIKKPIFGQTFEIL